MNFPQMIMAHPWIAVVAYFLLILCVVAILRGGSVVESYEPAPDDGKVEL